jgi:Spy/CpxP family protein refolding chaperone
MNGAPWRNPRIVYTLLFVFLSGAVGGAAVMRLCSTPERHVGSVYWKEGAREISLQRFQKELDLTREQAKQMEAILDDFMMYYQSLQAQMDDVRATGKDRILAILREDQKVKFEKMIGDIQSKQLR